MSGGFHLAILSIMEILQPYAGRVTIYGVVTSSDMTVWGGLLMLSTVREVLFLPIKVVSVKS